MCSFVIHFSLITTQAAGKKGGVSEEADGLVKSLPWYLLDEVGRRDGSHLESE